MTHCITYSFGAFSGSVSIFHFFLLNLNFCAFTLFRFLFFAFVFFCLVICFFTILQILNSM